MSEGIESGDKVRYDLHGYSEEMFCVGFMSYSPDEVALLATDKAYGMPINVKWLTKLSSGHDVSHLRDRYITKFGKDRLFPKPIQKKGNENERV